MQTTLQMHHKFFSQLEALAGAKIESDETISGDTAQGCIRRTKIFLYKVNDFLDAAERVLQRHARGEV